MRIDALTTAAAASSPANVAAARYASTEHELPLKKPVPTARQEKTLAPSHTDDDQKKLNVEKAVKTLNQDFIAHGIALKFSQDKESKTIVVEVIDQNTGKTLRQIPDETMLQLANSLGSLQGRVFDHKA